MYCFWQYCYKNVAAGSRYEPDKVFLSLLFVAFQMVMVIVFWSGTAFAN